MVAKTESFVFLKFFFYFQILNVGADPVPNRLEP
jgi:hypothetical protein